MHKPENNCPELTQETANAIDDTSLHEFFVSTQMNNIDLCIKSGLRWESSVEWNYQYWQTLDMSWNINGNLLDGVQWFTWFFQSSHTSG